MSSEHSPNRPTSRDSITLTSAENDGSEKRDIDFQFKTLIGGGAVQIPSAEKIEGARSQGIKTHSSGRGNREAAQYLEQRVLWGKEKPHLELPEGSPVGRRAFPRAHGVRDELHERRAEKA